MRTVAITGVTSGGALSQQQSDIAFKGLLYAITLQCSGLAVGATVTLQCSGEGGQRNLFVLANGNVNGIYYPVTPQHDSSGVAQTTTCLHYVDGPLSLVVASGGNGNMATILAKIKEDEG